MGASRDEAFLPMRTATKAISYLLLSAFRSWFAQALRLMLSELLVSYMPLALAAGRRICAQYEHESS